MKMQTKAATAVLLFFTLVGFSYHCLSASSIKVEHQVNGIEGTLAKNVLARLDYDQKSLSPSNATEINSYYVSIPERVKAAIQPFGYFRPQITTKLFRTNETSWKVIIQVNRGLPVIVRKIDIAIKGEGNNDEEFKKLLNHIPLKKGHPFTVDDYTNTKQALLNLGINRGYFKAELKIHKVIINIKKNSAEIFLEYDTGPRYNFGSVSFSPNPFKTSFLNRFIPFKNHQPYNTNAVFSLQDRLSGSGYFQQVLVQPQVSAAEDLNVPIEVKLTPRKSHQYNLGIGYGTDTGPRATLGWDWRRVTATGHKFSTMLQLSPVQNNIQATYSIPGSDPVTDQYNLNTSLFTNKFDEGDSRAYQLGAAFVKVKGLWRRTLSLNYQLGNFQLSGQAPQHSNFLLPGISWLRTDSDNPLYPRRGSKINISLQGASANLLSDTSFIQGEIQGKGIYSPTEASRLLGRFDVGYTTVQDLTVLPPNLRFFAGGSQSIRGFDYQSLGPGRYITVASIEYQHRIINQWNGAIFFDTGNASNNFSNRIQQGTGVGIVWVSPIGPLELTVAKALTLPGKPMRIQFAMGPDL